MLVSFPFFVSEKEVLSFLARNEVWIRNHQDKAVAQRKVYGESEVIQTKLHQIKLCHGKTEDVETIGKVVKVFSADFNSEKSRIFLENILNQVYRYEARKLLPPRLKELAGIHGFNYNKVSIRNNKRNWGSCSSCNNISLNLQMMKLPDHLIDYILLHELVHTEIKDHSERFWKKLDEVTGGKARELAKEVKKYSTYTL